MTPEKGSQLRRWGIFNLVGVLGFVVQITAIFLLKRYAGAGYLAATAIAVEIAVLHNFIWHEHLTWADVISPFRHGVLYRLLRFHLANGLISIAGNVALTWAFVDTLRFPYLPANVLSVLICSLLNFVAGNRFVFRNDSIGNQETSPNRQLERRTSVKRYLRVSTIGLIFLLRPIAGAPETAPQFSGVRHGTAQAHQAYDPSHLNSNGT